MKILPAAPVPLKSESLLHIQKKAEFLPPLSAGEVVEAEVIESSRSGKALILLKGNTIMADTKLPFTKGDRIAVRVAQLHPGVILRTVHGGISERAGVIDFLRLYRSNPKALSHLLMEGATRFSPEKLGELAAHLGKEDAKDIQDIFKSLIFSRESLKNPLFFKEYIHRLGYLMENKLGEALKRRPGRTVHLRDALHTLKGLLTKVSGRLAPLMKTGDLPAAESLAGFVRSSLQAIDSHQVINYLFQEYEGKYMFQVPLLFPGSRGMAEIFVKFGDRDSQGRGRSGEKSVLFLLHMDALGDIVAEAKIQTGKIRCVLKCRDKEICNFMKPSLGELGKRLAALGYDIECLECVTQRDAPGTQDEYGEFESLFTMEGVDLLA
ncbi:MAG: hypothetical protein JRD89_07790 [Deltaproteobacteria bacterium]|nr:hypothetical protein [Deltaproteobacteria bacterium]